MGLAAPRKKTKISHDPNNTNWSRSTSGFGHKILSSHGWTPGSFLGARNARHADMFTTASASHIKVIVKDDTLGLGARSKRDPLGEPTGLDAFKGLLGRLNGKSDVELQADQKKREDVKLARYAATKWQAVRFISAGLLNQEKVDETSTQELKDFSKDAQKPPHRATEKSNDEESATDNDSDRNRTEGNSPTASQSKVSKSSERRDKDKKAKKQKKEKKEKKDKKDKKRKRSEQEESEPTSSSEKSLGHDLAKSDSQIKAKPSPNVSILLKERRPIGRHVIRGRHIAQKRKALMDEKSLNEIFMIKS